MGFAVVAFLWIQAEKEREKDKNQKKEEEKVKVKEQMPSGIRGELQGYGDSGDGTSTAFPKDQIDR